jgi:hypothetical protein
MLIPGGSPVALFAIHNPVQIPDPKGFSAI